MDTSKLTETLEAGDGDALAELFAAARTHDLFFEVRPDRESPEQRRAYLIAAKRVLPKNFIRHLKLERCRVPVSDISTFCPDEMAELFMDLFVCALEEDDDEMIAQLHAVDPKTSKRIGAELDGLGHGLVTSGRFAPAQSTYDLALKFDSPGRSVYANALWVAQKDNTGLAIDRERNERWLAHCLPEAPHNPAVFFNAACIYVEQEDYDEAIDCIWKALKYGSKFDKVRGMAADPMFDVIRKRVDAIFTSPPASAHPSAWWSPDDEEWVHGEKDSQDRFQGPVHYWRPDGTLACVTEHIDGEPDGTFTRYHQYGDVSREGHILGARLYGADTTHRPTEWSGEATAMWAQVPEAIKTIITHWAPRDAKEDATGFGHQEFLDAEGNALTPKGERVPDRPNSVAETAVFVNDEWCDGRYNADTDKVGHWNFHAPKGTFLRAESYDDEGTLEFTTLPSDRSDAAFERGVFRGAWRGTVTLLDEAKNEIGSFDSSGADQVTDPALAKWVAEVRAVEWASLESAYDDTESVAHHMLVFGTSDDAEDRSSALGHLYSYICHQGSTYDASRVAMPLLVALASASKEESVVSDALELLQDMSLATRGGYERWVASGNDADDTTVVSSCASEIAAVCASAASPNVRGFAIRCLAACFENPAAAEFLAEHSDAQDLEEQALCIAALGNLRALPPRLIQEIDSQPPLMQLAVIYGCALSASNDYVVPDAVDRVLGILDSAGEDDGLQKAFCAFPLAGDSIVDELPFMVQPSASSIDELTDQILARLDDVRGLGATHTLAAALEIVCSDEDFVKPQSRVFHAIAKKDDLWQSEGKPVRLVNIIEVLEAWSMPTSQSDFATFCEEHDERLE